MGSDKINQVLFDLCQCLILHAQSKLLLPVGKETE